MVLGLFLGAIIGIAIVYNIWIWVRSRPRAALTNKSVFITGCDTGFGRLTSIRLHRLGWKVFANCYSEEYARTLKEETAKITSSPPLTTLVFSVTDEKAVKHAAEVVGKECPEGLWGVINNAGISNGFFTEITEVVDYKNVMDVNFYGMVSVTKYFLPLVKLAKGRIVNITSMAGRVTMAGMTAYSASKHAGEAFSDGLRLELSPFGVKVSIIEPGFMNTAIIEKGIQDTQRLIAAHPQLTQEYKAKWGPDFGSPMIERIPQGNPETVVDALEHALTAQNPLPRYVVGLANQIVAAWALFAPSTVSDWIIVRGMTKIFNRSKKNV